MRRIRVHIDIPNKTVVVKRGFFGSAVQYSGGWLDDYSIAEIIKHFEEEEDGRRVDATELDKLFETFTKEAIS